MYQLSRVEQKTTLRWDAEDQMAHIFTATPATLRKLDRLAAEFPEVYRCTWTDSKYHAKHYEVDARYIRFAKPPTEAQREAARAKLVRLNSAPRKPQSVGISSASAPSGEEIPVQTPGTAKNGLSVRLRAKEKPDDLPQHRA